ncbi:hypothetical protein BYZ73_21145 [Rhodovulum viride]|uniref:Uncharacterized protein n=1 Tax=Rhodovulum viride TaxID=1231134 RepID=A0ABX9DCJ8_9RHOB|nr:hypothetical protein [Rhodovulum viride]RAP39320.1 hypothetical protein BYZ73_21145 [Rhodovulum viride]
MPDTQTAKRAIEVRFHDTTIGIWQDDARDPTFRSDVFGPLIRMLRDEGWTVGSDPDIVKRYNSLRHDHRRMRKGALRGTIQISGRSIDIELWAETWPKKNQNGHRYGFNKRQRLDYLDRLRVQALESRIVAWLERRGAVTVRRSEQPRLAMDRIAKDYAESWHTDKALGRPRCDYDHNRRSADGILLEHGQTVWVPDTKGRIVRGQAFYNINSMWWVVLAKDHLTNKACFDIYAQQPEDLRRKRNGRERRRRLEAQIAAAVVASDFRRAETLSRIAFSDQPIWRIWSRKHDCFYAPQYSGYTSDANLAGRYTRDEAMREVRRVPHILHAIGPDGRREDFLSEAVNA